jgi:hypothetical protein
MTGILGIKKRNVSNNHSMKGLCRGNPAICRTIPSSPTTTRIRKKPNKSKFQGEGTAKSEEHRIHAGSLAQYRSPQKTLPSQDCQNTL